MTARPSVPVTVPATTARREFGDLIKRAFSGEEHFIIEKDGLPVVAIISMAEYKELMHERERNRERVRKFEAAARTNRRSSRADGTD